MKRQRKRENGNFSEIIHGYLSVWIFTFYKLIHLTFTNIFDSNTRTHTDKHTRNYETEYTFVFKILRINTMIMCNNRISTHAQTPREHQSNSASNLQKIRSLPILCCRIRTTKIYKHVAVSSNIKTDRCH